MTKIDLPRSWATASVGLYDLQTNHVSIRAEKHSEVWIVEHPDGGWLNGGTFTGKHLFDVHPARSRIQAALYLIEDAVALALCLDTTIVRIK